MAERSRDQDTEIRVSVLESQVNNLVLDVEKIEKKIDENYGVLHKRINALDDTFEQKNEKILIKMEEHSKSSTANNKELLEKINKIEKWRWMIMGGALIVGYVIAHVKIERLF